MQIDNHFLEHNIKLLMDWSDSTESQENPVKNLWIHISTGEFSAEYKGPKSEWKSFSFVKHQEKNHFEAYDHLSERAKRVFQRTKDLFLSHTTDQKEKRIPDAIPESLIHLANGCFGADKCARLMELKDRRQFALEIEHLAKARLESTDPLSEIEITEIARLFASPLFSGDFNLSNIDHYHPAYVFHQLNEAILALNMGVDFEPTADDPNDENQFAGNNESYFLRNKTKERILVFKPVSAAGNKISGLKGIPSGKEAIREHTATLLNYDRTYPIPYTAYLTIKGRTGSAQLYVSESEKLSHLRYSAETRKQIEFLPANPFQALLIFDLRNSNCDRNAANILCQKDGIFGIDHGGCMTACAEDPIFMEYLTLKQVSQQSFSQEMKEFILKGLDAEKDSAIMRRQGIEQDAVKWMEIATIILQESVKLSEESIKHDGPFLTPSDIAIVTIKLREILWKDPGLKNIHKIFLELLMIKKQIAVSHKQKPLTRTDLESIKTRMLTMIQRESSGDEYQVRIFRLNVFFNKVLPSFCSQLTGEDFNPYE